MSHPSHLGRRGRARASRRPAPAFTLIELLVVISIIALLISILLPALKSARDTARAAQCLSNLRQFGIATYTYAQENNDYIPPSIGRMTYNGTTSSYYRWFVFLYQQMGMSDVNLTPAYNAELPLHCPTAVEAQTDTIRYGPALSYARTYNLGVSSDPTIVDPDQFVARLGENKDGRELEAPSDTALHADAWDHAAPIDGITVTGYNLEFLLRYRHADRFNVGYYDGHAGAFADFDLPALVGTGYIYAFNATYDQKLARLWAYE